MTQRRFPAHWKLLAVLVAVVAVGLAIALPLSVAGAHRSAGSVTKQPDGGKHNIAVQAARARADRAMPSSTSSSGCRVMYSATTWPGQFEAKVTIRNTGARTINGWKLTFVFPGDQRISSGWNTTFTQIGARVSASHTNYYDAAISPGTTKSIGLLGTWTSSDTAPTSFRLNDRACT